MPTARIVLAGFSQGGAIALFSGVRHRERFAGVIGLSTYLVCAQDNGHLGALQREFARGAGRVVELVAAHHPFLSQPADVRDLMPTL